MNKRLIIPIVLGAVLIIAIISTCMGGSGKINLVWESVNPHSVLKDSIELNVYVENSGSMDAYMCPGSNLKDAVYDYISDLKKYTDTTSLYYINSQIIPYRGDLNSYIKDLTPLAFAKAGGNRGNTDLRRIFADIMNAHHQNSVSILVSDCILDIPENATDFFGNCQVSIKNTFNDALAKFPRLGVEIIQLESKFEGYWYCGNNSKLLSNVKRPYYIWLIGDQNYLSQLNKKVNVNEIYGGIKNYCAFSAAQPIPFNFEKSTFKVNHTNQINIQLLADLSWSLQSDVIIKNLSNYKSSNPNQTSVASVQKIQANSPYSHVIELEISNPETIKSEVITFSYPYLASWVETSNDSTGSDIEKNSDKTTGILYLIRGVAEAYKNSLEYGSINFNLKNK